MAASSIWDCLPLLLLLLVASFISLASAARIFPLDTDHHSSISTTSSPSDWLPVTGVKRKLYVAPLQHDADDDHSSVPTRMDNTPISYPSPDPKWLYEKGQGLMSDGDVGTKTVVDDLEDVGMDDSGDSPDGGGGNTGGSGWSWGGSDGGSSGGIGWSWGGGGINGGGHIGRGGVSIGGSGGSGRNSWHWGWHWGGGGSKAAAAANERNPKTGASLANAAAPMSN